MKKYLRYSKGYSVIEMAIVITIIGILTAISVQVYSNAREKSQDASALATLDSIKMSLEIFAANNGCYPQNISTPAELSNALGPYFPENIKSDGSAGSLVAVSTNSTGNTFIICAIGRDNNHYYGLSQNGVITGPNTLSYCLGE